MEHDVWSREEHLHKYGEEMIPTIGEVGIALVMQRVKVLSINADDTANVALITGTPLPDNAVVMMNGVPFEYMSPDTDEQ